MTAPIEPTRTAELPQLPESAVEGPDAATVALPEPVGFDDHSTARTSTAVTSSARTSTGPTSTGPTSSANARAENHPFVIAALFVIPYVLLMLTWAFANPPGAAPDEADHLVKAIGVGRLHIGDPFSGTTSKSERLVQQRNDSITREITVPDKLAPDGFKCTAFKPLQTARCLPTKVSKNDGTEIRATPVGAYPPFLYLPIGLAVRATHSPTAAFLAGRLVCLVLSCALLFLGAAHLARWLGRRALLGAFLALTPMAVFCGSIVSTSGFEITSSFALACVLVAATRRRESLAHPLTHYTLAVAGTALILSRELGSVTFTAIVLLLIARTGLKSSWHIIARRQISLLVSIAVLLIALGSELWWEHTYDHPSITGSAFDQNALGAFNVRTPGLLTESIGTFGWLDTRMPPWVYNAWIVLALIIIGLAVVLGSAVDRWSLVGWLVALTILAYVVYATVFYPIRAGLQGRHLLPFFMFCPLLAGVVAVDALSGMAASAVRRLFLLSAFVMPVIQFACLFINSRRYAVGAHGPVWFLPTALWSPHLGWTTWLAVGLTGSIALSFVIVYSGTTGSRPTDSRPTERITSNVAG